MRLLATRHLLLLACALALASCGTAQKASSEKSPPLFPNIKIDAAKKSDSRGPCEPSICINPRNPAQIAAGAILNRYYWSSDSGRTWQAGILKSSSGVFGDPILTADRKGNFYYAHLSDPSGKEWKDETILDRIVVQKSSDGGKTYDDGGYAGKNHPKDQDKQWIVSDPKTNNLYMCWTEFDKYGSTNTQRDHSRILFSKSTDGGATWSAVKAINQFDGDCEDSDNTVEGAVPAVGPNGEIYVAWAWHEKIWLDRSLDGGETWLDQDIVIADQPGGWDYEVQGITRCNGFPVLVCDLSSGPDRGMLYVNWSDQRNGYNNTDIWFAKSRDRGKSWTQAAKVNDDKRKSQQFFTSMAIDQVTGFLYIIYYDRRKYMDASTDVYVAVSRDAGKSFENMRISDSPFTPSKYEFFGDYNSISAHAGVVRPIWTRMDARVLSIWTAIMNFPVPTKRIKDIED